MSMFACKLQLNAAPCISPTHFAIEEQFENSPNTTKIFPDFFDGGNGNF